MAIWCLAFIGLDWTRLDRDQDRTECKLSVLIGLIGEIDAVKLEFDLDEMEEDAAGSDGAHDRRATINWNRFKEMINIPTRIVGIKWNRWESQ